MKKNVKLLACLIAIAMIVSMASISSFAWEVSYCSEDSIDTILLSMVCDAWVYDADGQVIACTGIREGDGPFSVYTDITFQYSDNTYDGTYNGCTFNYSSSYLPVGLAVDSSKTLSVIYTSHYVESAQEIFYFSFTLHSGIDF